MKRRGQVTLLVIIGVILLFTVSILLYLSRVSYTDQLQAQAQETVNEFIESNSLSQYVSTCLNRVATQGVELIGRQGGALYRSQGGLTPDPKTPFLDFYVPFQGYNISYGLQEVPQQSCVNIYQHNSDFFDISLDRNSEYPTPNVAFQDYQRTFISRPEERGCIGFGASKNLRRSGFLGYSTFSALCTPQTAAELNFANLPVTRVITCSSDFQQSDPLTDGELPSIERQLETFIRNNMVPTLQNPDDACFDKSIYEELGDEIDIDVDNFSVDVYFTDPRGILINAEFPFEVSIKGEKPIVTLVDFQQQIDINFLEMYRFLYELIGRMARDPFFDFRSQSYEDWQSYRGKGFSVELLSQPTARGNVSAYSFTHDDILRLTNPEEELDGEPYVYQVALRQRRPILDLISQAQFPFTDLNGDPVLVDYLLYPGQSLEFQVQAMDPNYDNITVEFFGWKQTTDSYFDSDCCANAATCNLNTYDQCLIRSENFTRVDIDECRTTNACSKEDFDTGSIPLGLLLNDTYIPNILQTQYETKDGFISLTVDETDTGYHEILVVVTDEHGAEDFQWIRVLVYDIPIAQLALNNSYPDVLASYASIEEPFFLDPRQSQASAFNEDGNITSFIYRIYPDGYDEDTFDPDDGEFFSEENEPFILPRADFSIRSIRGELFSENLRNGLADDEGREIDITLEVRQEIADGLAVPPSVPNIQTLSLYECLPAGYDARNNLAGTNQLIDNFNISISDPYYSAYFDSFLDEEEKFALPNVCCVPLSGSGSTPPHTGGRFADAGETCFDSTFHTCHPPVNDFLYQRDFLENAVIENTPGELDLLERFQLVDAYPPEQGRSQNSPFPNSINDVWELTQEQSCSGNRGNVCSGTTTLTWNQVEVCSDLTQITDQFARCSGPGLAAPFSFPSQCYARQETGMQCFDYGSTNSFERSILSVRSGNTLGHTAEDALAIGVGYCAGPTAASLSAITSNQVEGSTQGGFTCFASCGGSGASGTCAYSAEHCFCQEQTPTPTNLGIGNVRATDFLNGEVFSCSDDRIAYSNSCQVYSANSAESCYCQLDQSLNRFSPGVRQEQLDDFDGYFGTKNAAGWRSQGGNCCSAGVFSVSPTSINSAVDDATVCFDGTLAGSGTIFSQPNLLNRFLSFQGQVYYCEAQAADPFLNTAAAGFVTRSIPPVDSAGEATNSIIGPHRCTTNGWQ